MQTIITSDIYLVSAFLTLGGEIILPIDCTDSRHYRFTITGENLEETKQAWMNGELQGNLPEYSRCIKNVKLLIHDRNEGVGNAGNKR